MASIITATTTSGLTQSADNSGVLQLASGVGNLVTVPSVTGTAMVSGNMPAFSAYRDSNQSLSTSTATKITFVGEFFDTNSNFASDRFTPTVAGYYQINFTLAFTGSNATGLCYSAIFKNGSQWIQSGRLPCNTTLGNPTISVSDLIYCNGSTDYIEFYGFQNSGSSSNIGDKTIASGCLVRAA